MYISFNVANEKEFVPVYQQLVEGFAELEEEPGPILSRRMDYVEGNILPTAFAKRTDRQWQYLADTGRLLSAEKDRHNKLYSESETKKKIEGIRGELSTLEQLVMSKDIPDEEKEEISSYFGLMREQTEGYSEEAFAGTILNVESDYILPFLKITQAHVKDHRARDWDYYDKLIQTLPDLFKSLPSEYKDRIVNVLVSAAENGISSSSILFLSKDIIPGQLGLVGHDEPSSARYKKVGVGHMELYLETAAKLVKSKIRYMTEVLTNFPDIAERQGIDETRRIIDIALQIRDKDFPDEKLPMTVFYTGLKAGYKFHGMDNKAATQLIRQVEEKYGNL